MKQLSKILLVGLFVGIPFLINGQSTFFWYNTFETSTTNLYIDPSGLWDIGYPNKTIFDSSYSHPNSIVTDLSAPYQNNSSSTFAVIIKEQWGGVPNYLGMYYPLEIDFHHRFITDSINDFGKIEMSLDNGNKWYDVLSDEYNVDYGLHVYYNCHYFESTGDTLYDSLSVYGNSSGWVHSRITKDIMQIISDNGMFHPDSIIVKFTFTTDSTGGNDGWQIDNLNFLFRFPSGIGDKLVNKLSLYPNPANKYFILENEIREEGILRINNLEGKEISNEIINADSRQIIQLDLNPGVYIIRLYQSDRISTTRLIIDK